MLGKGVIRNDGNGRIRNLQQVPWEDQIQILKEECGLDFKIRRNDTDVKVR